MVVKVRLLEESNKLGDSELDDENGALDGLDIEVDGLKVDIKK